MAGHCRHGEGQGLVKARAVHFVAPRRVEVREVDLPAPAEGSVLVATEWSGISSGTELLAYRGEVDPDLPLDETLGALAGTFAYPFRYGYSAVGRVVRPAGSLLEGQLVFAFHPHQDRFVADGPPHVGKITLLIVTERHPIRAGYPAIPEPPAVSRCQATLS